MFITFEGPDGCGKTTQITLLAEALSQQGFSLLATREPGGTSIGEQIRDVVHSRANAELAPVTEILLYSASRAQITTEIIRPALELGQVVLCDRYYDSTMAYQGYGRGLDLAMLRQITQFATGGLVPDMTLYFDIKPDEGLRRRQQDTDAEWNRLDDEKLAFHQRVREGYLALIDAEQDRWVVLDAARPIAAIQVDVLQVVLSALAKKTS